MNHPCLPLVTLPRGLLISSLAIAPKRKKCLLSKSVGTGMVPIKRQTVTFVTLTAAVENPCNH